jgi:hypothetical protein
MTFKSEYYTSTNAWWQSCNGSTRGKLTMETLVSPSLKWLGLQEIYHFVMSSKWITVVRSIATILLHHCICKCKVRHHNKFYSSKSKVNVQYAKIPSFGRWEQFCHVSFITLSNQNDL